MYQAPTPFTDIQRVSTIQKTVSWYYLAMSPDDSIDLVSRGLGKLDFHHPYLPYDVQEQFMKTVYDVLEIGDGQIGILESPTGTVSPATGVAHRHRDIGETIADG